MKSWLLIVVALAAPPDAAETESLLAKLRSREASERIEATKALREAPGEAVSKAISRLVGDREPTVAEAAIRVLGQRGDGTCVAALRRALRTHAKNTELLSVVVAALGEAEDAESAAEIVKLARKAMGSDPALADAAVFALGSLRSPDAVAGLVELLGTAAPVRGGAASRAGHQRHVGGLRRSLQTVTGLPFFEPETWQAWWRRAKRSWQPSPLDPKAVTGAVRRDDGWRFRIERPDATRWSFEKATGTALRIRWAGAKEEAAFAWIDVLAHAPAEREPRTVEEAARHQAEVLRGELRDTKESSFGERVRYAGAASIRHSAVGLLKGGKPVRRRIDVLERHGILYVVTVHVATGVSERVTAEHEGILGSFRLLDR
jgi:hypothetical protein